MTFKEITRNYYCWIINSLGINNLDETRFHPIHLFTISKEQGNTTCWLQIQINLTFLIFFKKKHRLVNSANWYTQPIAFIILHKTLFLTKLHCKIASSLFIRSCYYFLLFCVFESICTCEQSRPLYFVGTMDLCPFIALDYFPIHSIFISL